MTDSKDYDDIPGFMRVPKGESLSPSRNTAGAFRELVHGNDGLSHAEFFPERQEKDEDDEGMTDAEKLAAAFAAGVTAVLTVIGTVKLVKRHRTKKAALRAEAVELEEATATELVVDAGVVEESERAGADLAVPGRSMTAEEWLAARQVLTSLDAASAEAWQILADAVIVDADKNVLDAQTQMMELSPSDPVGHVTFVFDKESEPLREELRPEIRTKDRGRTA